MTGTEGLSPIEGTAATSTAPSPSVPFLKQFRDEVVALLYCLGDKEHDELTTKAMLFVRESLDTLECELDPSLRDKTGGRL